MLESDIRLFEIMTYSNERVNFFSNSIKDGMCMLYIDPEKVVDMLTTTPLFSRLILIGNSSGWIILRSDS
jgi:hypothetical protein